MFYVHYEQAAPHPGVCHKCGDYRDLFDLGVDHLDGTTLLCRRCIGDLARFVGYTLAEPVEAEKAELNALIERQGEIINTIPKHTEELINGVRSLISDFIFTISDSSRPSSVPNDSNDSVPNLRDDEDGRTKSKANHPSGKSARK